MKCDIIIPVWDQLNITKSCIEHIFKNTNYPYRLILIDNGSSDETASYLKSVKWDGRAEVELIRNNENLGFVKAVNQGLKVSNAPYVCVLNNDTIPTPGWLERMIGFAETHKDIGLMNPQCNGSTDMSIEERARALAGNQGKYMEMNQCFGFCMLIKREVIDRIGYLDEAFGVGCYDDTDYSMRAGRAGYRCASVHSSYVHHIDGVSFRAMGKRRILESEGERAFLRKWPRHLRVGISFSIDDKTEDREIENLLKGVLFLAREWCWVNLWVFSPDKWAAIDRMEGVKRRIGMPLHQNIKYNFFSTMFKNINVCLHMIERSLGTKRRKKYDIVLVDDKGLLSLLNWLYPLHRMKTSLFGYDAEASGRLNEMIKAIRGER